LRADTEARLFPRRFVPALILAKIICFSRSFLKNWQIW
jgi:hypothetical protein